MVSSLISDFRKYYIFAGKGFARNLQYFASHFVNAVASAAFGVVFIYLWRDVMPDTGFAVYSTLSMTQYITFNQVTLWFTQFGIRVQRRIADSVRSGNIAVELARPVSFFGYNVSSEFGNQVYGLLFRGVPVGIILMPAGFYFPRMQVTWIWTVVSLLLGCYVSLVMHYLVGLASFWTTEIRAASWLLSTLTYSLGGASMPLDIFPPAIETLARVSPFATVTFYPSRIYLELSGPEVLGFSLAWAAALTLIAHWATGKARERLEVQGG